MVLSYLLEKEFKQTFRNRVILMMIVGFPVLVLLVLPWAVTFDLKDIRVAVVDRSRGEWAQRLKAKMRVSPYVGRFIEQDSYEAASALLDDGSVDIAVELPPDFDNSMGQGGSTSVYLAANAVDGTRAQLVANYMQALLRGYSEDLRGEDWRGAMGGGPVVVRATFRYNEKLDYKTFMLPAFIVLLTALVCGVLPALNIVQEKENGTIQQMNVTPVRRFDLILSKMIPYWLIGMQILLIGIAVIWLVYGLVPNGSVWGLVVLSIIFILTLTSMGMIVSNHSRSMQQAMFLMMFFVLILLLLCGLFTPIYSMPGWAQAVAYANPLTYYMDGMRMFYLRGAEFTDAAGPMWKLSVYCVAISTWAVLSYRKVDV